MKNPKICVLYGGCGNERSVSLESGKAVIQALQDCMDIIPHDLREEAIPEFIQPQEMLVFPVLHGSFGENGSLQAELAERGIEFCGCDAASSAICIDKIRAKLSARSVAVPVAPDVHFSAATIPSFNDLCQDLGCPFVIKPVDEGSSVGLFVIESESHYNDARSTIKHGHWMAESKIIGLEISVGVLDGQAQGIVAIRPEGGVYDFKRKYTSGSSSYEFPARLPTDLKEMICSYSESIFKVCGCRDYARIDYIVEMEKKPVFLEINTLPGLTQTSLLPKSASCGGLDFVDLLKSMLNPAIDRWQKRYGNPA